ncbi:MAG: biosynthetic-type acetolactate synthase large subunit [Ruminococcus sp.]|nr:biosynthetic-type acetolactate synthase large subunit [Ruminococcus sp.]
MKMSASKAMVECLKAEGINTVYGYPGAAICPFFDALLDEEGTIRNILVRHEANGGHAASGFARMTGRPQVCIATSGPGAVNLITAIATAYADSVPIIAITGQVATEQIGSDAFQEADITGAAEPFVKHSYLVKDAGEIPRIFKEAFYIAGSGRPGPVLIDVPVDVQKAEIDFEYPKQVKIRSYKPTIKGNAMQVKRVAKALKEAKRPLICIGGGVFASRATEEVRQLSEIMDIPVITTMMGISCFNDEDERFFGMIGTHGVKSANAAANDCDTLLLVGARVGDRAVNNPLKLEQSTTIIHMDIDPAEIGKNIGTDIPLVGNAKDVLAQLLKVVEPMEHKEWIAHLDGYRTKRKYNRPKKGTVDPRQFIEKLSEKMPANTTVVADVGQNQIWAATGYKLKAGGRFLTSGGMGTMGYSLPCAMGAKMTCPERTALQICGDGSFQMQFMEMATCVQYGINVKIVVMTNRRLGMVRELQDKLYDGRKVSVFLDGSPDFVKLAAAYGIPAMRVHDTKSMNKAIEALAGEDRLMLVEVCVDEDAPTL